jgi:hypothetical protein
MVVSSLFKKETGFHVSRTLVKIRKLILMTTTSIGENNRRFNTNK